MTTKSLQRAVWQRLEHICVHELREVCSLCCGSISEQGNKEEMRGAIGTRPTLAEMAYLRYRLGPSVQLPRLLARLLSRLEIAAIG